MFQSMMLTNPWFDLAKSCVKTIEGRLCKDKFAVIKPNDNWIIFNHDKSNHFFVRVKEVIRYNSFEEYLSQEGLKRTLPNIRTIEEGVQIYRQFYTEEQEASYGIIAIHFEVNR